MTFGLQTWKTNVRRQMQNWKLRMERAGVTSIYAFLSAATIWPIVQAARVGEWEALTTLGSVLAGLGTNLVANRIQGWKDEVDAARQIESDVNKEFALRAEFDVLLERLETLDLAQKYLSKDDQIWFVQTLRTELAQLGNLPRFEAVIAGNGAIAHGENAMAIGQDVRDSVIVTGQVTGNIWQIYQSASGNPTLNKEYFAHVLQEYLSWVKLAYSNVRLLGAESIPTIRPSPLAQLHQIFVPISLSRSHLYIPTELNKQPKLSETGVLSKGEENAAGVLNVALSYLLTQGQHLAIIGGAGSGKSTLLRFIALKLASTATGDSLSFKIPEWLKVRQSLPIPLVIPLRYYHEYLERSSGALQEEVRNPRIGTLADFIPWYLKRRSPALELSSDFFDRLLLSGGCLVMLDGLDEITSQLERSYVRQQVEYLVNDIYPRNQFIVTAREAGYREDATFSEDFVRLDIQPLSSEQISRLVENWCTWLYPERARDKANELAQAIYSINNLRIIRDQPPLISSPLLITIAISVDWSETELPRERARLYEACVRVMLQAHHLPADPIRTYLTEAGGTWQAQRRWFSAIALEMQRSGKDSTAIRRERLERILRGLEDELLSDEVIIRFVDLVEQRGGILEEKGGLFQFVHLTFQEFLAARRLAKQRSDAWPQLAERVTDPSWREVFLLIYGYLQTVDDYPPAAQAFIDWLSTLKGDDTIRLAGVELASAAVLEVVQPDPIMVKIQSNRLATMLAESGLEAPGTLVVAAGDMLAQLGDSRPGIMTLSEMQFCLIPGGMFWVGSPDADEMADNDEKPLHQEDVPYDYWIARYPITNAQFQEFVNAEDGYKKDEWWTSAGLMWRGNRIAPDRGGGRTAPDTRGGALFSPTHPVVMIRWYEAVAFTNWLTSALKRVGLLQINGSIRLPSETEWEKAARGGLQVPLTPITAAIGELRTVRDPILITNPDNQRCFPWGNTPDTNLANVRETGIGRTSSVGCFGKGGSPYGVLDMSGNVFEWCSTKWRTDYFLTGDDNLEGGDARVMRGGAFGLNISHARCTSRSGYGPLGLYTNLGFRVVISSK